MYSFPFGCSFSVCANRRTERKCSFVGLNVERKENTIDNNIFRCALNARTWNKYSTLDTPCWVWNSLWEYLLSDTLLTLHTNTPARPERAHTQHTYIYWPSMAIPCVWARCCAVLCRAVLFSLTATPSSSWAGSGADFEFLFHEATKIYDICNNLSMLICFFRNIHFFRNLFNALLWHYLWRKREAKKFVQFINLSPCH